MSDSALWISAISVYAVAGLVDLVMLFDGAHQVATGGRSMVPLERLMLRRAPATEMDCIRQGAYKVVQATAMLFIAGPSGALVLMSLAGLTGGAMRSAIRPAYWDLVYGSLMGGMVLGLVFVIVAYWISTKLHYVPIAASAGQN